MNAKVFIGLMAIAALAAYDTLGLDVKYLVYVAIVMIAVGFGAWFDSIEHDED